MATTKTTQKPSGLKEQFEEVIEISSVKPRGLLVKIDGETYETVPPSWWGAEYSLKARKHSRAINKYEERLAADTDDDPTDEEMETYKYHLRSFVAILMPDCPREVINRQSDVMLGMIVGHFMEAFGNIRQSLSGSQAANGTKTNGHRS